jgi:SpoIID/LytB domain protein
MYPSLPSKLPNTVNIKLSGKEEGALIEVRGGYRIYDPHTGKNLANRFTGKSYRLCYHEDGIQWGEIFPGIFQIAIMPDKSGSILVDGIQYSGAILGFLIDKQVHLSNLLDIEECTTALLAVKSIQDPTLESYPREVIDAIAIALRSTLFSQILFNRDAYWHMVDKEVNYRGKGIIHPGSSYAQAIGETRHLILAAHQYTTKDLIAPIPAMWSRHCGGKTIAYQTFYRQTLPNVPAYSIVSEYAERSKAQNHWKSTIPLSEIKKLTKLTEILQVQPYIDASSEKPYAFRFSDRNHAHCDITTLELMRQFPQIKSSQCHITLTSQDLTIEGYGQGDGVGICLETASILASHGRDGGEILQYFFPGSHLLSIDHPN